MMTLSLVVLFYALIGAVLGHIRGEQFFGHPPVSWSWLIEEGPYPAQVNDGTGPYAWNVRRWVKVITFPVPLIGLGLVIDKAAWFAWPVVYAGMVAAWSSGHLTVARLLGREKLPQTDWSHILSLAITGALVAAPLAGWLIGSGAWLPAAIILAVGALKAPIYLASAWLLDRPGVRYPWWWSVQAEWWHGATVYAALAWAVISA